MPVQSVRLRCPDWLSDTEWWLITEEETERRIIPKVKPKTLVSDPEIPLIAHSLKARDRTGEEGLEPGEKDQERERVNEGPLQAS